MTAATSTHGGSTADQRERKLAQIRALLAKAEDPAATPHEADAYNRKAAELIAQYGIDSAMLAADNPTADVIGDRVVDLDPPYSIDKGTLLHVVATACRCRTVLRGRQTAAGRVRSMHLFGFGSDLDRAELLYTSLLMQSAAGLAATWVPPGANAAAFRRSWLAGFATAVDTRLKQAERQARMRAEESTDSRHAGDDPGRSVAVVLADRDALVNRVVEREYPNLRRGRGRTLSGSGYDAGYCAGRRADLGSDQSAMSRAKRRTAIGGR